MDDLCGTSGSADVIAYLRRRLANARTMRDFARAESDGFAMACDRVRQLEVMIEEIGSDRHHGEAAVAAAVPPRPEGQ
jgi:hypothetical protein